MSVARRSAGWLWAGLVLALAGPLLVFIAAFGARVGLWGLGLGYERMTLAWGWPLAWVSAAAALFTLAVAARSWRRGWPFALMALTAAFGVLAGHVLHRQAIAAHPPVHEAATDWDEPPGFSGLIRDQRASARSAPLASDEPAPCDGAVPLPRQIAPQTAATALQEAGFTVVGSAPFRVEGVRQGFWFGFSQDAVVRIRPGRTDVRVSGREARADGGEACRLTRAILEGMAR